MNKLNSIMNLKGNQAACHRQLLKSASDFIFVSDVCNFTDLTASQVRSAFTALIKKGLVSNAATSKSELNMYTLNY